MMPRSKRHKPSSSSSSSSSSPSDSGKPGQHEQLLPGLPDDLAQLSLSTLPPSLLFSVCRTWRHLLYSPSFPRFPSLYALLSTSDDNPITPNPNPIHLSSFDPVSSKWSPLPPPPLLHGLLLTHPSYLSRQLPIQSSSTSDHLLLVSATNRHLSPAISSPLVFDPISGTWREGPPFLSPRRWCAVGSANGSVYVASGVGSEYSAEVARSVTRWDVNRVGSGWEVLSPLRDGRFSREPVEMVSSNGKLCMVNSRGWGAKEGAIYDVKSGVWDEMPNGLLTGWSGPATSIQDGGDIFAVDEASGELRRYEWERDTWTVVMRDEGMKGAVGIAGGGGRVCVTCEGGGALRVVDVFQGGGGGVWTVLPPKGRRVIALHVLPRMSQNES